jgi:hypothetical protein
MDRLCLKIALNSVDFPTFGRPTMTTDGKAECGIISTLTSSGDEGMRR